MQNLFIKVEDKTYTKILLHFHIEYSKKTPKQPIIYRKDFHFRILFANYLKNIYISLFILFQNSLNSVHC